MTLEALGNLGDLIGGIGVIVTLIYLAVQIRQNTIEVRNAAVQRMLEQSTAIFGSELTMKAAEINSRIKRGEEVSESDQMISQLAIRRNFQLFEQVYLQYLEGRITQEVMDAYKRRLKNHFARPDWEEFWTSLGPTYTKRFSQYVDEVRRDA